MGDRGTTVDYGREAFGPLPVMVCRRRLGGVLRFLFTHSRSLFFLKLDGVACIGQDGFAIREAEASVRGKLRFCPSCVCMGLGALRTTSYSKRSSITRSDVYNIRTYFSYLQCDSIQHVAAL